MLYKIRGKGECYKSLKFIFKVLLMEFKKPCHSIQIVFNLTCINCTGARNRARMKILMLCDKIEGFLFIFYQFSLSFKSDARMMHGCIFNSRVFMSD